MMQNLFFKDFEFITFFAIEVLILTSYLLFYRYSRNHNGVFDRRVSDRRDDAISNWRFGDRRVADIGFGRLNIDVLETNDFIEVSTDRRVRERRMLNDRRQS